MKFETTEFHCCPAVSRNYGGKTKEIIIIINLHIYVMINEKIEIIKIYMVLFILDNVVYLYTLLMYSITALEYEEILVVPNLKSGLDRLQ